MANNRLLGLTLAIACCMIPFAGASIGEVAGHLQYVTVPNMSQTQRWGITNLPDGTNSSIAWSVVNVTWSGNYTHPPSMSVTQPNGTLAANQTVYIGVIADTQDVAPGNYTGGIEAVSAPSYSGEGAAVRPGTYKEFSVLVLPPPTTTSTSVSTTSTIIMPASTSTTPQQSSGTGLPIAAGALVLIAVCCGIAYTRVRKKPREPEYPKVG